MTVTVCRETATLSMSLWLKGMCHLNEKTAVLVAPGEAET